MKTRLAAQSDRDIFTRLWAEYLLEHRKKGSYILPSVRTMDYFLGLFDDYTLGRKIGVVVLLTTKQGVCMWGCLRDDGLLPYDHECGTVASGHGVYVRPVARHQGAARALWERAAKVLKRRGVDCVIETGLHDDKQIIDFGVRFGFEIFQTSGLRRL